MFFFCKLYILYFQSTRRFYLIIHALIWESRRFYPSWSFNFCLFVCHVVCRVCAHVPQVRESPLHWHCAESLGSARCELQKKCAPQSIELVSFALCHDWSNHKVSLRRLWFETFFGMFISIKICVELYTVHRCTYMPHFSHECWCVPCSMHECDWYWKVLSASWLVLCLALPSPLRTFWTSFPPVRSGFRPSLCSCWPLSWIGFVVLGYVAKNCECACPGPLEKWTFASWYMYIYAYNYTDIYRYIHTFFLWQQ